MKPIGKQWRLEDKEGKTLRIIKAVDRAAADLRGSHLFPGTYHHAVDIDAEKVKAEADHRKEGGSMKKPKLEGILAEMKSKARRAKLRESFKRKFLREGRSEEEAQTMADIAARGRNGARG